MAHKQTEEATLEDLEQIFKKYGHKPQIAHGLAVALEDTTLSEPGKTITGEEEVRFLLRFLDQEYESPVAGEPYVKVVKRLLELLAQRELLYRMLEDQPHPLHRLIDFLGQHPPVERARGKVRDFLANAFDRRLLTRGDSWAARRSRERWSAHAALSWESLARALLHYQMFVQLESFVENKVYEAIPVLFEVVVEQVGEENAYWIEGLVRWRWDEDSRRINARYVAEAFLLAGSDTRWLRLLFDLAQAYLDEYRERYPLEELRTT